MSTSDHPDVDRRELMETTAFIPRNGEHPCACGHGLYYVTHTPAGEWVADVENEEWPLMCPECDRDLVAMPTLEEQIVAMSEAAFAPAPVDSHCPTGTRANGGQS